MADYFRRLSYLILTFLICEMDIHRASGQCQCWDLQRLNENSPIYFMNTSISDGFILSCWVWKDSRSGGTWDTRFRIGLDKNDSKGGGFNYKDSNGKETLSLRWVESSTGNVTWRASTNTQFPVSSWNISATGSSWGYSTSSDGRWYFFMDNKTVEPTTMPITNVILVKRWRRSNDVPRRSDAFFLNGQQGGGASDFFETVTAIFSTVLSTLTSTIANVFNLDFLGGGMDSDDGDDVTTTPDPDSEPISTPTTTASTTTTDTFKTTVRGSFNNNEMFE